METVVNEETALAIPSDLHITRSPREVLEGATLAAIALKEVIGRKSRKVVFNGEQYLQYEDWQTIGGFFRCSVATGDAELVQIDGVPGFKAKARVIDENGIEVSTAEAYCMKDEGNWKTKPLFQLASMAQTRAGAKALRNKFAWVAVLAGYSGTPAEEIETQIAEQPAPMNQPCPECNGPMWDNRTTKKGKQPDFKCKDKSCGKGVWLPKKEDHSTDAVVREELFNQAEKYMTARNYPEDKRKEALGRLVAMTTGKMAEAVDKLVSSKPVADEARSTRLLEIKRDVLEDTVTAYLADKYPDKKLEELSLDALNQLYDDCLDNGAAF